MQDQQLNPELKSFIDQIMPEIDEVFTKNSIPIHDRFMRAAIFFVEHCVQDCSLGSNKELVQHEAFAKDIVPLFMQWYYETYGELAKPPHQRDSSGIAIRYAQPIRLKIPLTITTPTDKGTCWLKFPDGMDGSEDLKSFIDNKVPLDILDKNKLSELASEISSLVSLTRRININLMTASGLDPETASMMGGIWSHFEKAIDDIMSFKHERISVGCWELHLAMEKSFKVLIKQKTSKKAFGHDLLDLYKKAKDYCTTINVSLLQTLPSDTEAIQFRYAEQYTDMSSAIKHYNTALEVVLALTEALDRKLKLNNVAFEIKQAPWAI